MKLAEIILVMFSLIASGILLTLDTLHRVYAILLIVLTFLHLMKRRLEDGRKDK